MPRRASLVAGHFYDADPVRLRAAIDTWLGAAPTRLAPAMTVALLHAGVNPNILATPEPAQEKPLARLIVLPHAGHLYCGEVLGQTLSRVRLPSRLILLCPSHTGVGAPLAVWPDGAWATPLGEVPVDAELAASLCVHSLFTPDCSAHLGEHSLEVILPFLQIHSPDARIVPVCLHCAPHVLESAAAVIAACVRHAATKGDEVGLVISTDMNHFADEARSIALDALALAQLCLMDPVGLFNTVQAERISMCGVLPATLGLFAAHKLGMTRPRLASYATSAKASGDASRVVGYAGFYAEAAG